MGHWDDMIASLRVAGSRADPALWREDSMAEWLVAAPADSAGQRAAMVEALAGRLVPLAARLREGAVARALAAVAEVPREAFVCPWVEQMAYLPMSLAIGLDQVISHPELAATLAAAADPQGGRVLDVGTGSGYQAALLSRMAGEVVSVEILGDLALVARDRLAKGGFANVEVIHADGGAGEVFAPASFDAVVVAAGAAEVPEALLAVLRVGGRLVMPVGAAEGDEQLLLVERLGEAEYRRTVLRAAQFVPLTGVGGRG